MCYLGLVVHLKQSPYRILDQHGKRVKAVRWVRAGNVGGSLLSSA